MNLFKFLSDKGQFFKSNSFNIFFGNDSFNGDLSPFTNLTSHWLHQVHGTKIVEASSRKHQADGQYTTQNQQALFIKTADCMPVFLIDKDHIFALHIGWRGLMGKILTEACRSNSKLEKMTLFVGPHIGFDSFQLDLTNANSILLAHEIDMKEAFQKNIIRVSQTQNNHYYINLLAILTREANALGIKSIQSTGIDTFRSPWHFSHRRNRWRIGQNFSFAMKI